MIGLLAVVLGACSSNHDDQQSQASDQAKPHKAGSRIRKSK
ncbi:hypothetical protein PO124_12120 [Bacillus licheniformis]|nr:hypothetical protein [Bacillus licheniformis]